jgi:Fe-S cluster biogenesis protein NfuA
MEGVSGVGEVVAIGAFESVFVEFSGACSVCLQPSMMAKRMVINAKFFIKRHIKPILAIWQK